MRKNVLIISESCSSNHPRARVREKRTKVHLLNKMARDRHVQGKTKIPVSLHLNQVILSKIYSLLLITGRLTWRPVSYEEHTPQFHIP